MTTWLANDFSLDIQPGTDFLTGFLFWLKIRPRVCMVSEWLLPLPPIAGERTPNNPTPPFGAGNVSTQSENIYSCSTMYKKLGDMQSSLLHGMMILFAEEKTESFPWGQRIFSNMTFMTRLGLWDILSLPLLGHKDLPHAINNCTQVQFHTKSLASRNLHTLYKAWHLEVSMRVLWKVFFVGQKRKCPNHREDEDVLQNRKILCVTAVACMTVQGRQEHAPTTLKTRMRIEIRK